MALKKYHPTLSWGHYSSHYLPLMVFVTWVTWCELVFQTALSKGWNFRSKRPWMVPLAHPCLWGIRNEPYCLRCCLSVR
jgi:hypothetical protein